MSAIFDQAVRNMVVHWMGRKAPISELVGYIGTDWSDPEKMRGTWKCWSLSNTKCKMGSKLAKMESSVCAVCYAGGRRYRMPDTVAAMDRRFKALTDNPILWTAAQITLIKRRKVRWFRWHDSGDLQGKVHLHAVDLIARWCPDTVFWLPTKEYNLIKGWESPDNLAVRVSHPNRGVLSASVTQHFPLVSMCRVGLIARLRLPVIGRRETVLRMDALPVGTSLSLG